MTVQRACKVSFLSTALSLFLTAVADTLDFGHDWTGYASTSVRILSSGSIFGAIGGSMLCVVLGVIAFRKTDTRSIRIAAITAALLPLAIGVMWFLFRLAPNVHGASGISLSCYVLISEPAALCFLIASAFKRSA